MENVQMLPVSKQGRIPGGLPSTDFELVSPLQTFSDPKMKQRDHIDWLLASSMPRLNFYEARSRPHNGLILKEKNKRTYNISV